MNFNIFKKIQSKNSAGFTIIELVIVFSISAIIFAVVTSGYPNFLIKSDLENTTLEVALTIREAQVYGTGVREAGKGFNLVYGAWFDLDASHKYFTLFTDNNNNKIYDNGERVTSFVMKSDFEIKQLCIIGSASTDCSIRSLAVLFKRPDPDAIFNPSGVSAIIKIRSKKTGDTKTINITNTGQISVQ